MRSAEIELGLTEIRAPFEGVTTASQYSIGNVVTANQTESLMTLRRLDPIYIDLTESSVNLLRLREAINSGRVNQSKDGATDIRLTLEDGMDYPVVGKLDMSEMAVSQTTARSPSAPFFDNPNKLILPACMSARRYRWDGRGYLIHSQRAATRSANGELFGKIRLGGQQGREPAPSMMPGFGQQLARRNWDQRGDKLIVTASSGSVTAHPFQPVEVKVNENGIVEEPAAPAPGAAAQP